jgi:hypothetical protein
VERRVGSVGQQSPRKLYAIMLALHMFIILSAMKFIFGTGPATMVLNDIARDEELDFLDPLRHLMYQPKDNDADPGELSNPLSVLPRQSHSVQNEIHELSFVDHRDASQPPITITLSVDASPGCGGIAWPAGQVRTFNISD